MKSKKNSCTSSILLRRIVVIYIIVFLYGKSRKLFKKVYINQFYAITQFSNHSRYNILPICKFYCKFSIHIIVFAKWAIGNKMFSSLYKICKTFYGFWSVWGILFLKRSKYF